MVNHLGSGDATIICVLAWANTGGSVLQYMDAKERKGILMGRPVRASSRTNAQAERAAKAAARLLKVHKARDEAEFRARRAVDAEHFMYLSAFKAGMTYKEIGDVVGKSEITINKAIAKVREGLNA